LGAPTSAISSTARGRQILDEREAITMFRFTISYVRYALSTLTAVAFGIFIGN
jgi:hypothetical protein